MIAYVRVALAATTAPEEVHKRDISALEQATLTGEGETWDEARAAVQIPEGAVVLGAAQWPI
ncbi:hypothetical protein NHL51_01145 [Leucobacter sp. gxy201]|uniref:hypothetical protein n=1 Tax=Leucobacter sp. gxy201 TaxID=2957200 RepID=UPI003DA07A68